MQGDGDTRTMLGDAMPDRAGMQPEYSEQFRCIGPACEDTCCAGWSVVFDQAACAKYASLPDSPLKVLIETHVKPLPPGADGTTPESFAKVELTGDNACPFLNAERYCQIQVEHGEEYLSTTCAVYPRIVNKIDGREEKALTLSCPEAARLVLLSPDLLHGDAGSHLLRTAEEMVLPALRGPAQRPVAMLAHFWPLRAFVLGLLTHREYAVWQRLFLLGVFTRRVSPLARGELDRGLDEVMKDFAAAVDSGMLRGAMDSIQADLPLQLDMVLRLAGLRLPRTHVGQRFMDTVDEFKSGIGNGAGATMESLTANYAEAHERWYAPFFEAYPHVLENLLVNAVFRSLFPFGRKSGEPNAVLDMEREFALLATQFALMKGLLIGVAGHYREAFGAEHVVKTVQAASKHFEHHPGFLDEAYGLLVAGKLDNARGLTMLVRN